MYTVTGTPPNRRAKLTLTTDYGPMTVVGGEAPYHLSVFAELYVNRVQYEISMTVMLWPDHDIDCVPDSDGSPSPQDCLIIQRIGGGAGPSKKTKARIIDTLCTALNGLPEDFLQACNRMWVQNRTHPIQRRIAMLDAIIGNLMRDAEFYETSRSWYV